MPFDNLSVSDVTLAYLNIYLYTGCVVYSVFEVSSETVQSQSFLWTEFIVVREEDNLSQQTQLCGFDSGSTA